MSSSKQAALRSAKAHGLFPTQMDLKGVTEERARNDMMREGVIPLDYGGDTPMVPISAKTGMNVQQLLEEVVLMSDASLELLANPGAKAKGAG